jgi:6-phosphogluconolactonase (cycloisomerase 2 family)
LDTFLHHINFKQTEANPTIYIQVHDNDNFIFLAIYVDDGIVVTPNLVLDAKLRTFLKKEFKMIYKGDIYFVVGLWIIYN